MTFLGGDAAHEDSRYASPVQLIFDHDEAFGAANQTSGFLLIGG
jgi:hypothetical protein